MVDGLASGTVTARVVPVLARVQALISGAHLVGLALRVGRAPRHTHPVNANPALATSVVAGANAGALPVLAHFVRQAVGSGRAFGHAKPCVAHDAWATALCAGPALL